MTVATTTPNATLPAFARHEPVLTGATILFALACLPVLMAMWADDRMFQDVDIWAKPLKFLISTVTYFGMMVWVARWLPAGTLDYFWYRLWIALIVFCAAAENIWITAAAANGIGSHFNDSNTLMSVAYMMAGIMAVTLLTGTLAYGVLIWRNANTGLDPAFRLSVIFGLIVTFPLTFVIAGYLGGAGSHLVGGNASDAEGMILTGWARDGGDLRVGHFFALHAMHIVPACGWVLARLMPVGMAVPSVWALCLGYTALTIFTFVQALMGAPFLPMIP
ncbi:MAG: hypothetical protein AAF367_00235 [Pseudomonadota bacterium]